MKQIIIMVGPDGSVSIEAQNYKGTECDAATRPFEVALGQITKKQRKPEFYSAKHGTMNKYEKLL